MTFTFIKNGEKYYISDGEMIFHFNEENLARVKNSLSLPAKVYFHNCPFDFLGKVVANLFDETTDLNVSRINRNNKESLDYEASFTKVKELPGMGLK